MRTFKIDKYIPQWIAIAATLMCLSMTASGEVLVSNFFDDDSNKRGNLSTTNVERDDSCCGGKRSSLAIKFTVGGDPDEVQVNDHIFEGVQLELRALDDFQYTRVRLHSVTSSCPGSEDYPSASDCPSDKIGEDLKYVEGSAYEVASRRYRGRWTNTSSTVLEVGSSYFIGIDRPWRVDGDGRSQVYQTDSNDEDSANSLWAIGDSSRAKALGNAIWQSKSGSVRLAVISRLRAERLSMWYYECPMGPTKYWHWIRFRTDRPIYISSSELRKAFTVDGGSVDKIKRIRWTHEYIDGIKRKVTSEYRLRIIPGALAQDVTVSVKESEGCGGSSLCAAAELGLVGDYEIVIPGANRPPTLSISENTEHPNYDSMDEGFLELGDMSFSTTLSGPPISHYRFEVKTVEGKNKGTATPCTGSTKVCKDKEDPDDYYPGEHVQFIIAVLNDENELVFEDPATTLVYLVDDAIDEDDESVVVKIHEAWTVGDRSKRYCPISITTSHATGMILDDD